jgi:hypothetical protein
VVLFTSVRACVTCDGTGRLLARPPSQAAGSGPPLVWRCEYTFDEQDRLVRMDYFDYEDGQWRRRRRDRD